jgi:uncharacterized protein (TIGR00297 family)
VAFYPAELLPRLFFILGMVTSLALVARFTRAVTLSGALAGWLCAFALIVGDGFPLFAALVAVFVCVSLSTAYRYGHKDRLGLAERRAGRTARQVFANLGVAAVCALADGFWGPERLFGVAAVAALAEAAADTVSSEVGQAASASPRLITTFQQVPAGTDGAISWPGTLAGLLAAAVVATVAMAGDLISLEAAGLAAAAGFMGMLFDSLLGATLQRRGHIGNNVVNLLGTGFAALLVLYLLSSFELVIRLF